VLKEKCSFTHFACTALLAHLLVYGAVVFIGADSTRAVGKCPGTRGTARAKV